MLPLSSVLTEVFLALSLRAWKCAVVFAFTFPFLTIANSPVSSLNLSWYSPAFTSVPLTIMSDGNVTLSVLTLSLVAANAAIDASAQIISAANVLLKNTFITFLPVCARCAFAFELLSSLLGVSDHAAQKVALQNYQFDA